MTAEIICVGTELLLGNIVNTNAAFISCELAGVGISCFYQTVVGDNEERLLSTVGNALDRSDIIILSGGLGPTKDDLTKETVARAMGLSLIRDTHTEQRIKAYFEKKGVTPSDNIWKQCDIPEGANVIDNDNGTAPGLIINKDGHHVILLPGVPMEMKWLWNNGVRKYLSSLSSEVIVSTTVKICGIGESKVETMISDIIENQTNPTIAPYCKPCEVHVRVTAKAENEKECRKLIKPVVRELKNRFGEAVYGTGEEDTLEKAVVDLLKANDLTVTTAESCTGGLIAARLVNVPGVSDFLKTALVTYSNKAKRKFLQVKKQTINKYSVISKEVALEMVKGAAALTKADVAVAVTGNAGPEASGDKPVGRVCIACQVCGSCEVIELNLVGDREKIRENAVSHALILMRECILKYYSKKTFGNG